DVENENLFDKTLMNTIRTWVIYKNNHSWTSYLSPIAFFSHNPIIVNQNQTNAKPLNEIRIATALENEYYVFTNLALLNKIGVEYRFFDGLIQDNVRIRYKCNARFDLSKKTVFILGDELFINLRNTTSQNNFDHNRVFFQTQFKLSTASKIDFGYIFITRSRKTAPFNLQEHNLVLN
ncbi:DUF2490 domain-containing protein, partial [Microcystis aeruginosa]|uniref:DUF2490 domain-containing protein n=1 Tax=Microcystis aeruginosa TaxID=1126 RepID=UPI0009338583